MNRVKQLSVSKAFFKFEANNHGNFVKKSWKSHGNLFLNLSGHPVLTTFRFQKLNSTC